MKIEGNTLLQKARVLFEWIGFVAIGLLFFAAIFVLDRCRFIV